MTGAVTAFCACGRVAGGRCTDCGTVVCYWPMGISGFYGADKPCATMVGNRLRCLQCQNAEKTTRQATEADALMDMAARVEAAAPRVASRWEASGRESLPLAVVKSESKTKSAGGMATGTVYSHREWNVIAEELGSGWVLATHSDGSHGITMLLRTDGALFAGRRGPVLVGRTGFFAPPQRSVLQVTSPWSLDHPLLGLVHPFGRGLIKALDEALQQSSG